MLAREMVERVQAWADEVGRGRASESLTEDALLMVRIEQGNLLEANAEALVNTVNTVGVMGKGIALMFKERFPENFRAYAAACKFGEVQLGRMFVTRNGQLDGPRWIVNFPTKDHWRSQTRLEWIESGMEDLVRIIAERGIRSVAVPPLDCGNGAWIGRT